MELCVRCVLFASLCLCFSPWVSGCHGHSDSKTLSSSRQNEKEVKGEMTWPGFLAPQQLSPNPAISAASAWGVGHRVWRVAVLL